MVTESLWAKIAARQGWGYAVEILDCDQVIDEYRAGDSQIDSRVYSTGETPWLTLAQWAKMTAKAMLKEHGAKRLYINYDRDILPQDI